MRLPIVFQLCIDGYLPSARFGHCKLTVSIHKRPPIVSQYIDGYFYTYVHGGVDGPHWPWHNGALCTQDLGLELEKRNITKEAEAKKIIDAGLEQMPGVTSSATFLPSSELTPREVKCVHTWDHGIFRTTVAYFYLAPCVAQFKTPPINVVGFMFNTSIFAAPLRQCL